MTDPGDKKTAGAGGMFGYFWQRKVWWILPLGVLLLLLVLIYVLGHLSAADPEMYPTTMLNNSANAAHS